MDKVSVIIPAYNEEDCIAQTIESLKGIAEIAEIIVVDDGSSDKTLFVLSEMDNIKLVRHGKNKGKGEAVKSGLKHISSKYVLLLDADIKESGAEVKKMLCRLGENRMVIGVLPVPAKKNGFGVTKLVSDRGFKLLTKRTVSSVLSGQRLLPADFINKLELPGDYSLEFKITLEAVRSGLEIIEIPVQMQHREYGRTLRGFLHRSRQCGAILHQIAKEVINVKIYNRIFH